jgi:hypothetical protein
MQIPPRRRIYSILHVHIYMCKLTSLILISVGLHPLAHTLAFAHGRREQSSSIGEQIKKIHKSLKLCNGKIFESRSSHFGVIVMCVLMKALSRLSVDVAGGKN